MRVKIRVYADAPQYGHWSWRVWVTKNWRNKARRGGLACSQKEAWEAAEAEAQRLVGKFRTAGEPGATP